MPAIWTTPKTWATGEALTAADLNTHLRDNLEFLRAMTSDEYRGNESADWTTTSTSFVDVDNTRLRLEVTTKGGDLLIGFYGTIIHSAASQIVCLDVEAAFNGGAPARLGIGPDGLALNVSVGSANIRTPFAFVHLYRNAAAGSWVFDLQWKTSTGTATLYGGATTNYDATPQFWVKELN